MRRDLEPLQVPQPREAHAPHLLPRDATSDAQRPPQRAVVARIVARRQRATKAPLKESPAPTVSTTSVFKAPALRIMIAKPSTAQAAAPCSPQAQVMIFWAWPRLQKSEAFLAKNFTGSR